MHLHKKFQKSKNSVSSSDTDQNRFVVVQTFSPLGVNNQFKMKLIYTHAQTYWCCPHIIIQNMNINSLQKHHLKL
jgi:hypothetical protein